MKNDDLTTAAGGCGAVIGSIGCNLVLLAIAVVMVVFILRWLGVL